MTTALRDGDTPAGLGARVAAAAIDAAAIAAIAASILLTLGPGPEGLASPGALVLTGAVAMFYRVFTEGTARAATPGKRALGLRVRPPAGGRLDFAVAALRAFPWWLAGALAGVDPRVVPVGALLSLAALVPILFDAERRGLHDRLAGTAVIRDHPEESA